jgi:hypothetical protein
MSGKRQSLIHVVASSKRIMSQPDSLPDQEWFFTTLFL